MRKFSCENIHQHLLINAHVFTPCLKLTAGCTLPTRQFFNKTARPSRTRFLLFSLCLSVSLCLSRPHFHPIPLFAMLYFNGGVPALRAPCLSNFYSTFRGLLGCHLHKGFPDLPRLGWVLSVISVLFLLLAVADHICLFTVDQELLDQGHCLIYDCIPRDIVLYDCIPRALQDCLIYDCIPRTLQDCWHIVGAHWLSFD